MSQPYGPFQRQDAGPDAYECLDGCGVFRFEQLKSIHDLLQRVSPGESFPAGECPTCGSLCEVAEEHLEENAVCKHCGDPITVAASSGHWVDENGLESCAPHAERHESGQPPGWRAVVCDLCGDESNSDPDLKCGRDLTSEINEALNIELPDEYVRCPGTYRTREQHLQAKVDAATQAYQATLQESEELTPVQRYRFTNQASAKKFADEAMQAGHGTKVSSVAQTDWWDVVVMLSPNQEQHILKVNRLRDPAATCSCGRWNWNAIATDSETDGIIWMRARAAHRQHVNQGSDPLLEEG